MKDGDDGWLTLPTGKLKLFQPRIDGMVTAAAVGKVKAETAKAAKAQAAAAAGTLTMTAEAKARAKRLHDASKHIRR